MDILDKRPAMKKFDKVEIVEVGEEND